MAPTLRSTAGIERLVETLSNVEKTVINMAKQLTTCHDIILKQQDCIISQEQKITKNTRLLNDIINHLLEKSAKTTYIPSCLSNVNMSLNDSGPQGITVMTEDSQRVISPTHNTEFVPHNEKPVQKSADEKSTRTNCSGGKISSNKGAKLSPKDRAADMVAGQRQGSSSKTSSKDVRLSSYATAAGRKAANSTTLPHVLTPDPTPGQNAPRSTDSQATSRIAKSGLKAAPPRIASLHLFNFSEDTKPDDILGHLESRVGVTTAKCEQLTTRGKYSSFKLDVPNNKVKSIRDTCLWPEGTSIRKYKIIHKNVNSSPKN